VRAFELHDLVEQDGDGLGHAVEAVLGEQFRDLEGGSLSLGGDRRGLLGVVSLPSKGTGGGPPLQAEANLQKG
jgi:hypothetical protein